MKIIIYGTTQPPTTRIFWRLPTLLKMPSRKINAHILEKNFIKFLVFRKSKSFVFLQNINIVEKRHLKNKFLANLPPLLTLKSSSFFDSVRIFPFYVKYAIIFMSIQMPQVSVRELIATFLLVTRLQE